MRIQIISGLLAVALVSAASATARTATTAAGPTLTLVHRGPLVVQGAHFRARELVRLSAAAGTTHAVASATTTRTGAMVARFHWTPPLCLKLVIQATGQRGDHARLVIKPPGGPGGVPCGE